MNTWYGGSDGDKMVKSIEQGDRLRVVCGQWFWKTANFLPPGLFLTSFLLFPPVLQGSLANNLSKENASIGAAFACAACGFLPLFMLPFTGLRSRILLLGNRLCLTAGLFGVLNLAIHLAYDLTISNMVIAALALAVSQIVCYAAVIWLRSRGTARQYTRQDCPCEQLHNLQMEDKPPKTKSPSNLEHPIWV